VTREAAIEAVFRYPSPAPLAFFPWLRETIAHRALDKLCGELPQVDIAAHTVPEAAALQQAWSGSTGSPNPRCVTVGACEPGGRAFRP
jgi:hypothetical protein